MTLCKTPFGDFKLQRIPDNDKNLQAWNAADLYLLKQLDDWQQSGKIDLSGARILIMNDAFGTLTTALSQYKCDSLSDSFISHTAMLQNINNNCPENIDHVRCLKSTDELDASYDLVLFKEVKSHTFLKAEMLKLHHHLSDDALIVGAIMAKNLQKNTLQMLSQVIGHAQASLAWKKSRLIFIEPDSSLAASDSLKKHRDELISTYPMPDAAATIYNLANVFSRNKPDIGSRLFLQHFPAGRDFKHIIDLGCGNGLLSLKAAQLYPQASISCIDESYMAVASAKMTLEANLQDENRQIEYLAADALSNYTDKSVDLIICNPPFHQQYVVGDAIAWQMFKQSKTVLQRGGELWIVGNRHLAYHLKLKRIFGNQELIAANKKFVILKAVKH